MDRRNLRRLLWGLFLIAVGVAFMLRRYGLMNTPEIEQLWPAVLWVIAIGRFIDGRIGSGVSMTLLGAWFFACAFGWMGLDYRNSWPLVLVAIGTGIMIRAFTGEDDRWKQRLAEARRKVEERHEG